MSPDSVNAEEKQEDKTDTTSEPSTTPIVTEIKTYGDDSHYSKSWNEIWGKDLINLLEEEPLLGLGLLVAILVIGIAIGGLIHPFGPS
jgi:hypothetical protein